MKLLVIGSGGREHALAWKLAQSPKVRKVYVAPGNAGTGLEPFLENVPIPVTDIEKLADFAEQYGIAFTVVGPEGPLAAGIVDIFQKRGLKIFGPTQAAAQLESSKDFAKRFMLRHHIPTAAYQSFDTADAAHEHVNQRKAPMVVKADGLAAGKGAVVCETIAEAHLAIDKVVALGEAGKKIIIEDFVDGEEEASFIVMSDGEYILALDTSQDHKRLLDGDKGSMTGGMGAHSPAPIVTPAMHQRIMREIIIPAVSGMAEENIPYAGFLYAGLKIDRQGNPKVLEFNCRLGDPETQPIMLRLKSDLYTLILHAINGTLFQVSDPEWDDRAAVGVVLAAAGYPDAPKKGATIYGLSEEAEDCKIFHAGTLEVTGDSGGYSFVVNGGRVMCVTALGDTVEKAQLRAYQRVAGIHFNGMQFRHDIGHRAIGKDIPGTT